MLVLFLLFVFFAAAFYLYFKFKKKKTGKINVPHLKGPGNYRFDIVGESHYQDNLFKICGGKTEVSHKLKVIAALVREPDNPVDKKAVRVEINGLTVGHISKQETKNYHKLLKKHGWKKNILAVDAMIVGGWIRNDDEGSFGVKLDMPFVE